MRRSSDQGRLRPRITQAVTHSGCDLIGGLQTNIGGARGAGPGRTRLGGSRDARRIAGGTRTGCRRQRRSSPPCGLDRPRLADALADACTREGRTPELLIEVNTGAEPQKSGIARDAADRFITDCRARFGAALRGLMCIPPADEDPSPHFTWLADRAARHGLAVVSMGMSADFERAIACGATHVRVGSAIFGAR